MESWLSPGRTARRSRLALAAVLLPVLLAGLFAAPAAADDGHGPDHWRVHGLQPYVVLTMHAGPSLKSKIIGTVPHTARRLKNMGCTGGMSFAEWQKASPAERKAARFRRWCKVVWKGRTGWLNGAYLRED